MECWGSVGATLHTPQTLYTSAFQKIGGSGEVFGDFRLFCVNPLEKYSYQPIPQQAQPVPRLGQPVPHLYQLYKKKSGAPLRSSALTIHECLLLILVLPVVAAGLNASAAIVTSSWHCGRRSQHALHCYFDYLHRGFHIYLFHNLLLFNIKN